MFRINDTKFKTLEDAVFFIEEKELEKPGVCSVNLALIPNFEGCWDVKAKLIDKDAVCIGSGTTYRIRMIEDDQVNHPSHYTQGSMEVIDAIEGLGLGFCEGNILKYIARANHKGQKQEDLEKALWYLNRLIQGATEDV
jgi:hypothetical protein